MAVSVSLSATAASADGILDTIKDTTKHVTKNVTKKVEKNVVHKVLGGSKKGDARGSRKESTARKQSSTSSSSHKSVRSKPNRSSKAKSSTWNRSERSERSQRSQRSTTSQRSRRDHSRPRELARSIDRVRHDVKRTVRHQLKRVEKTVQRSADRVERSSKSIKESVSKKAKDRDRSRPATSTREAAPTTSPKPDKAAPAGKATSGVLSVVTKELVTSPVTTITADVSETADAALGTQLSDVTAPLTSRVTDLVDTSAGRVDGLGGAVLRDARDLVAVTGPVLEVVEAVLPDRSGSPQLPGLPLLPELPGLPEVPAGPLPAPTDAADGLVAPTTNIVAQLPDADTTPVPVARTAASTATRAASAPMLPSTASLPFGTGSNGVELGFMTGTVMVAAAAVAQIDGAAVGQAVGLAGVAVLAAAGAVGATGAIGSGGSGLSFVAVAATMGFSVRPGQHRVDIAELRLAAWQRPHRPGFSPD